jgi:hypothetical protein
MGIMVEDDVAGVELEADGVVEIELGTGEVTTVELPVEELVVDMVGNVGEIDFCVQLENPNTAVAIMTPIGINSRSNLFTNRCLLIAPLS